MTSQVWTRNVQSPRAVLALAFRWWIGELRDLIPGRVHRILGRRNAPARFEFRSHTGSVLAAQLKAGDFTYDLEDVEEATSKASFLVEPQVRRISDVEIILTESLTFSRDMVLPRAAERDLEDIVGHQLGTISPAPASQVVFGAGVRKRSHDGKSITVTVLVAKRSTLDRVLQFVRESGFPPSPIYAEGILNGAVPKRFVLWRPNLSPADKSMRRWCRSLELVAGLLLLSAYVTHLSQLSAAKAALLQKLPPARQAAAETRALSTKIESARATEAAIRQRQLGPQPLHVLNELSRLLPDDTWLTQLTFREHTVEMAGISARATSLVGLVEGSDSFRQPRFRSPVTLSYDGQGERFDLTFELRVGQ